jgi:inner membrane protein involved in colicin E2 resistance
MAGVKCRAMLKTGIAILGLMGVLYGISKIDTSSLIKGALAIAVLGVSLVPLALGLMMMNMC